MFGRTDAEPPHIVFNPDAAKERARSKPRSVPQEVMDSPEQMQLLVEADMIRPNRQFTCFSMVMAFPKQVENCMVVNYRVANVQVKLLPWLVPDLETIVSLFDGGAGVFIARYRVVAEFLADDHGGGCTVFIFRRLTPPIVYTDPSPTWMLDAAAFPSQSSRRRRYKECIWRERCLKWVSNRII